MSAITYETFANGIGFVGVVIYICAYTMLQMGVVRGATYTYACINLTAASCVLLSLTQNFNMSSATIQICWIVISLFGITRLFVLSRIVRFSEEEEQFRAAKMPLVPRHHFRKLLNRGFWVDGEAGTVLTAEGEVADTLFYLSDGEAEVRIGDAVVGFCRDGIYIGEMSILSGEPATGTVTLAKPSRYFCISADAIRRLGKTNRELRFAIENSFAGDMREKLIHSNTRALAAGESARA